MDSYQYKAVLKWQFYPHFSFVVDTNLRWVGKKTADLVSFDDNFQQKEQQISWAVHKLPTIESFDGAKTITQAADLGRGTFQQRGTFGQQTTNLTSFDGTSQILT